MNVVGIPYRAGKPVVMTVFHAVEVWVYRGVEVCRRCHPDIGQDLLIGREIPW